MYKDVPSPRASNGFQVRRDTSILSLSKLLIYIIYCSFMVILDMFHLLIFLLLLSGKSLILGHFEFPSNTL